MAATGPNKRSVGRNDPCPCGSGRKFKQCCLNNAASSRTSSTPGPRATSSSRRRPTTTRATTATLIQQARQFQQAGQLDRASMMYQQVVAADPQEHRALAALAQIASQFGVLADAISFWERAIAIDTNNAAYLRALAEVLWRDARAGQGLDVARRAIDIEPQDASGYNIAAYCLESLRRYDDAIKMTDTALEHRPDDLIIATTRARLLRRNRQLDDARTQIQHLQGRPHLSLEHRRRIANEHGMILDKLGEYDAAFDTFSECGECSRTIASNQRLDPSQPFDAMSRDLDAITPTWAAQWGHTPPASSDEPRICFLVGFPRSGTTMTEQILAAHDDVVTADEKPILHATTAHAFQLTGATNSADMLSSLTPTITQTLRTTYWKHADRYLESGWKQRAIVVDKAPLQMMQAPIIHAIFPEAKVLWVTRDPRDTVLSCFMQDFRLSHNMANLLSISDAARFFDAVMAFWAEVTDRLPMSVLELCYEDTVRDLETQAHRIVDHLAIDWRDDLLSFHERARDRVISTPSFEAVTEAVHTRAVQRWRNYERHFEDALPCLARWIDRRGFESGG